MRKSEADKLQVSSFKLQAVDRSVRGKTSSLAACSLQLVAFCCMLFMLAIQNHHQNTH